MVFISGVLFLILSVVGLREMIFNAISPSMKNAIATGIGLFIAFIGLQEAGVIIKDPGSAVKLNAHFLSPDLIIFFVALLTTAALHARNAERDLFCSFTPAQRVFDMSTHPMSLPAAQCHSTQPGIMP